MPRNSVESVSLPALALACVMASSSLVLEAAPVRAEPYKIDVILPITGGGSFLGKGQQATLEAFRTLANAEGGIQGQPIEFVYHDDQSSPQTAVQIASAIVAEKPPVVLGSSLVGMCNAIAPLMKNGPFDYCLSPGAHPAEGSNQFSTSVDTHSLMEALVRTFRLKGWTKIAFMTSTDASGQDAERGFDEILKLPENASIKVVERQRFNPTDVSVSAQIERVRAAEPQAFIAWSTGAPVGTIFKAILQAGLDVPVGTTNGNQTYAQMEQYKDFLPKQLYFPASEFLPHAGLYQLDPRVEAQQVKFYAALKAANLRADNMAAVSWDPAALVVETLRKLGPKATGEEVRAYLASQTEMAGINGLYNFKDMPQRGLKVANAVVTQWDPAASVWRVVSAPAGEALQH